MVLARSEISYLSLIVSTSLMKVSNLCQFDGFLVMCLMRLSGVMLWGLKHVFLCVLNLVQLNIVCSGVSSSPALQCTQVGESFLPMRKRYAWKDPCPVNACVM